MKFSKGDKVQVNLSVMESEEEPIDTTINWINENYNEDQIFQIDKIIQEDGSTLYYIVDHMSNRSPDPLYSRELRKVESEWDS